MQMPKVDAEEIRSEFLRVLQSRRSAEVPLEVKPSKPVENPLFQSAVPSTEIFESPTLDRKSLKELLEEENLHLNTEAVEQGSLPLLILSLKERSEERRPAVVFLHSTNSNKEWLRPWLEAYAARGYVAIGLDSRHHGERANCNTSYRDALISSWKNGDTMPFIYDTVWDLIKLADYLTQRKDIDPKRIGITGISLGGMHAWFAAAVDTRYSAAVPLIGVQGFRWAIDNEMWQARVDSIKPLFEEARMDLGKDEIDKEVVEKVWDRIAPGLASQFDSPYTLPIIAPRPLYVLNGEEDPRCPVGGLQVPLERGRCAYEACGSPDNFKVATNNTHSLPFLYIRGSNTFICSVVPQFTAEAGVGHQATKFMINETSLWFDSFFKIKDK